MSNVINGEVRMTAIQLAAEVRRHGGRFAYDEFGVIVAGGLDGVLRRLRRAAIQRLDDIRAVISEHSVPRDYTGSDVADAARKIALHARKAMRHA